MRTKLTRFLTITVLALVLGIASAAPVAAQSRPPSDTVTIVLIVETTVIDTISRTITVETTTYFSNGGWSVITETRALPETWPLPE